MRVLTLEEIELVAGGTDTINGVPVTDLPGPVVTPDPTPSGPITGPSGGSSGGDGSGDTGGGSGSGSTGSGGTGTPALHATSAGGHPLTYHVALDAGQLSTMGQIVDYGVAHGFSSDGIRTAVDQAYYESSFNQSATNGSHVGLYQYNTDGWNGMGHAGANINDQSAQIAAIYNDIMAFGQQYTSLHSTGAIPWDLSFEDYFEIKHHLGQNYPTPGDAASMNVVNAYNDTAFTLGFGAE